MGEIDLIIAIYNPVTDTISVPYAHEAGEKININPFPLGQGFVISILMRTQQPLILVEEARNKHAPWSWVQSSQERLPSTGLGAP